MKKIQLLKSITVLLVTLTFLFLGIGPPLLAEEITAHTNGTQVVVTNMPGDKIFEEIHQGFKDLAQACNFPFIMFAQIGKWNGLAKVALEANPAYDANSEVAQWLKEALLDDFVRNSPECQKIPTVTVVGYGSEFIEISQETDEYFYKVIASEEIESVVDESLTLVSNFQEVLEICKLLKDYTAFVRSFYAYPINLFNPNAPYYLGPPSRSFLGRTYGIVRYYGVKK